MGEKKMCISIHYHDEKNDLQKIKCLWIDFVDGAAIFTALNGATIKIDTKQINKITLA